MGATSAVPVLVHPDPRSVLGGLAATVYGNPSQHLRVIGVTGTSGKTTTTYLVEAGLRAADRVAGLIGTVGIRIAGEDLPSALTTPEAPDLQALLALMVEQGVDTVVMEVSSHALSLGRVDGVEFAVGGFTNLSRDHLDFHPTMEDYFDTKARLFDPESPTHAGTSVVCIDDDAGRAMAALARRPGDGQRDRPRRRLAGRGRPHVGAGSRRRPGVLRRRPRRGAPRTADRAARPLQRRELSARRGAAATRSGCHPNRPRQACGMREVPGPAGAHRPRPGLPGAGRLRPQARRAARRAGDAARSRPPGGSRWCSARAATATPASASRWAGWRPSWPTWWWSPTTTRATRIPPRSASAIVAGAARRPAAQVVEIGDRREAIDHAVAWASPGTSC